MIFLFSNIYYIKIIKTSAPARTMVAGKLKLFSGTRVEEESPKQPLLDPKKQVRLVETEKEKKRNDHQKQKIQMSQKRNTQQRKDKQKRSACWLHFKMLCRARRSGDPAKLPPAVPPPRPMRSRPQSRAPRRQDRHRKNVLSL